ncbi:MAG: tetratricopeptide repeat protein [Alphaproteobacteria bacterium]|nr:tetratricopeptide repeat protein [Alphaproteobacteria bacterium]
MIPNVQQTLGLGWQLVQAGNIAAADELVRPLIVSRIDDELVPLVGAIRLSQGRFAEAAALFERGRALNPHLGRFAFFHGTALASMGQFEQAVPAFLAAIKMEPNAADAYLALGMAQRKLGRPEDALTTYRKLLRAQPEHIDGYIALGSVLAETGQMAQAEAPLRKALSHARDPKLQAAIHNNLSIVLGNQNKHAEALENLERTQALAPELPNLDNRRIDILHKLGRFDDCAALYERLLARAPADADMHRAYNSFLYRLGRKDQYLTSFDWAPQTREILLGKAAMLALEKRGTETEQIYSSLLARDPLDAAASAGWANSLSLMGRHGEAVAAFETVLSRRGANIGAFSGAAAAALMAGDPQKAEAFCQAGLRQAPHDQSCLAMLGTAWRLQGKEQDEELNGYDSLIRVFDLEPPEGFSSMADFNAELGGELERLHPKTKEYLEQSLHGGSQTEGHLFGAGHVLVEKLRPRIEEALSAYIAGLAPNEQHPFLSRRRNNFRYAGAWSSLMRSRGFHMNHLHPQGWISSCYYVTVPEVAKDESTRQGWIKFGEPELDVALKNPIRRAVQPVPGRLVLFPSYMWHGTIPFQDAALRTTIAFDAVPL